ncbi:major facilitator superfamily domain-containing protein [Pseudomassariella vexata]|uniref:Major facilitator superfamily domain-containing protein n=1 Tax=Pseudomassariella vexata TaxID=1141098 RepID=A0A1Y2EFH8_9PEZI|nr:major facilitator superfamily domain-containing protein [Pseudomassariella vexata]ORY70309.1 major facilitator superfamily domain-containing protein [Pseudomassariella vexata]
MAGNPVSGPVSRANSANTGRLVVKTSSEDTVEDTEGFRPDLRLKLAFVTLAVLTLMVAMNDSVLAVALPVVAEDLHGTAIEAFWAGTAFLLTEATFMAPLGALSSTFGRVPILNFAASSFLVGTVVASTAPNFSVLILGRAIQGIGGGGVRVSIEIVVADLIPLEIRGNYLSIFSVLWAIGDVLGPIVGGIFSYKTSWRWNFWMNIPIATVALVSINIFLRLKSVPGSLREKVRRADWAGTAISVSAVTTLLLGMTWGGVMFPWDSWQTIIPILVGLLGLFGFAMYEKRFPVEPIIRIDLLCSYNMLYSLMAAFFHTVLALGLVYVLPLYFEGVKEMNPIMAGIALIPYGATVSPFSAVGSLIISRTGNINWVIRAGFAFAILGSGLLTLLDVHTLTYQWVLSLLVVGLGLGLLYNSLDLLSQASVDEEYVTHAVTMLNFFRHLGQAAGVAIVGVVVQNEMRTKMDDIPDLAPHADEYSRDAAALVENLRGMPEGQFKTDLVGVYAASLWTVWIIMCAFCVLPFAGSFFLRCVSMKRKHETAQGLRRGKNPVSDTQASTPSPEGKAVAPTRTEGV